MKEKTTEEWLQEHEEDARRIIHEALNNAEVSSLQVDAAWGIIDRCLRIELN